MSSPARLGASFVLLLTAPIVNLGSGAIAQDAGQVTIALLSSVAVDDVVVSIDQIAQLSGGSSALRQRIGKLDIADLKVGEDYRVVTADQVHFRLLLAGIEPVQFRLAGVKRTMVVESDKPISARKLIAAAQLAVRAKHTGDSSRLTIHPCIGLVVPDLEVARDAAIRFEATLKWTASLHDRVRVDVAILVDGRKLGVTPVYLDLVETPLHAPTYGGKTAEITPVGNWTPAKNSTEFLIKARDNVKLVFHLGSSVRVEATAEAQQDGKAGQVIRVRNLDSNRIVSGRVEASGVVIAE